MEPVPFRPVVEAWLLLTDEGRRRLMWMAQAMVRMEAGGLPSVMSEERRAERREARRVQWIERQVKERGRRAMAEWERLRE